jgi:hypothetical protein
LINNNGEEALIKAVWGIKYQKRGQLRKEAFISQM